MTYLSVRVGGAGSCCKLPTLNYKFDVADDDIEMEALLGEQAEFKGQVRRTLVLLMLRLRLRQLLLLLLLLSALMLVLVPMLLLLLLLVVIAAAAATVALHLSCRRCVAAPRSRI